MEDSERVQARLDNIQSVLPILSALRTVSLGRWQTAQQQQRTAGRYAQRLRAMRLCLEPHLPLTQPDQEEAALQSRRVIVAVGSNRGLCGRFNKVIAARLEQLLAAPEQAQQAIDVIGLGKRLVRLLESRRQSLTWSAALPRRASDLVGLSFDLTRRWRLRQEAGELSAVDLIYNRKRSGGRYEPVVVRLMPTLPDPAARFPEAAAIGWQVSQDGAGFDESWPPPIIETDADSLRRQIAGQDSALNLYARLLESLATEQATRFQLMEAATQNAERLIDELKITVQTARRQAITQDTQALAVGAGLLEAQPN